MFLLSLAAVFVFVAAMLAGYATDSLYESTPTGALILLIYTALEIPIFIFLFGPTEEQPDAVAL